MDSEKKVDYCQSAMEAYLKAFELSGRTDDHIDKTICRAIMFAVDYGKYTVILRGVAATTACTAMAIPVFVGTKKKIVSCALPLMKASLVKPDSHMHVRARKLEQPSRFMQSSNSEHVFAVESHEWQV